MKFIFRMYKKNGSLLQANTNFLGFCFDRTCQSTHSSSVQLGVMQQSNHFELGEKLLYLNQILTEKLILFHKLFLIRRGKHKHVLHI